MELHCPICDKVFSTEAEGVHLPFCSKRCKLIDRARWLDEDYGLPYESEEMPEQDVFFHDTRENDKNID